MTNKKGFLSQMLKIVKMEEVLPKQRKGKSGEEAHPLHWRGEKREYHHFVAPTSATTNDGNFVVRCWKFMLDNDFFEDFTLIRILSDGGGKHFKTTAMMNFFGVTSTEHCHRALPGPLCPEGKVEPQREKGGDGEKKRRKKKKKKEKEKRISDSEHQLFVFCKKFQLRWSFFFSFFFIRRVRKWRTERK